MTNITNLALEASNIAQGWTDLINNPGSLSGVIFTVIIMAGATFAFYKKVKNN